MRSKVSKPDQPFLEKLKKGDKVAFDALFYAYEPILYAYAVKMTRQAEDAREIVQEVFLKIWEKRTLIEPANNFEGFLFTIAKNLVYNKAKRRIYDFAYKEYAALYNKQSEYATENSVFYNELTHSVQRLCEQLPPARREVFLMSRIDGLSNKEIAGKLNTSTSNVKNQINKALRFLKAHMQSHEYVPIILLSPVYHLLAFFDDIFWS